MTGPFLRAARQQRRLVALLAPNFDGASFDLAGSTITCPAPPWIRPHSQPTGRLLGSVTVIAEADVAMPYLDNRVYDNGLSVLSDEASHLHVCSDEPATFADVAEMTLGNKAFAPGELFGAPTDREGGGRMVTSVPVTDGTVTGTGRATHYAVTDEGSERLLAADLLAVAQEVTFGNTFVASEFNIEFPAPL